MKLTNMNTQPLLVYPELLIKVVNTNLASLFGAMTRNVIAQANPPMTVHPAPNMFRAGKYLGARFCTIGPMRKTE
jgi:hypothetical protein